MGMSDICGGAADTCQHSDVKNDEQGFSHGTSSISQGMFWLKTDFLYWHNNAVLFPESYPREV